MLGQMLMITKEYDTNCYALKIKIPNTITLGETYNIPVLITDGMT